MKRLNRLCCSTRARAACALLAVALGTPLAAPAAPLGPQAYQCFDATQATGLGEVYTGTCSAESPFAAGVRSGAFASFAFEDWESFTLNQTINPIPTTTPGVAITSIGGGVTTSFSVDQDDGAINGVPGSGAINHAAFGSSVSIVFDANVLGGLPTHVGFVVTGGNPNRSLTVDFFDASDQLLGSVGPLLVCSVAACNTVSSDDRFVGFVDTGGIRRVVLNSPSGISDTWNWDHLQYGRALVPEPSRLALFAAAALALGVRQRNRRRRT
jgi:hypothetical protein